MLLEAVPGNGLAALVLPALVRSTGELNGEKSEEPKTKKEGEREEK
jgi:hypothetical protein